MSSAARRARGARRRAVVVRVLLGALALALVVLVLGVLGYRLNVPTTRVAVPTARATPDDVVRAYVAAYDARDLATVRAIDPGGGAVSRFRVMGSFSDLVLEDTRWDDRTSLGAPAGADPDRGRVYVPVTMTAHGMDTAELGFSDGPMLWGFFLERSGRSEPWVVVDQGVG